MNHYLIKTSLSATSGKTRFNQRLTLTVKSSSSDEAKEKLKEYLDSLRYEKLILHEYSCQVCADVQFITATNYER